MFWFVIELFTCVFVQIFLYQVCIYYVDIYTFIQNIQSKRMGFFHYFMQESLNSDGQ